jgi:hypothetical protein
MVRAGRGLVPPLFYQPVSFLRPFFLQKINPESCSMPVRLSMAFRCGDLWIKIPLVVDWHRFHYRKAFPANVYIRSFQVDEEKSETERNKSAYIGRGNLRQGVALLICGSYLQFLRF